ncbi:hypothetical protein KUL150_11560 [Alteromonas sp. KUL150]|uniref:PKD domain-containing protein n=1 Tax=Alteromonas sp. KUL150 TaxID=2480805 RepID=UPI0012E4548D|nr:sialate O-acetylesterase [Alteromonas sp. KUL150]GFD85097.1 hypothetical protein KUL150_11560 [Alteromonas sp. KUL150]
MANSALWSEGSSTFTEQIGSSPTLSVSLDPINLWSTGNLALFTTSRIVAVTLTSDSPVNILYSTNGGVTFSSFATNATSGVVTRSISLNIGTYNLVFKIEGEDTEYSGYQAVVSRLVILGSGQSNMAGAGSGASEPLYTDGSGNTSWLLGMNDVAQPMKNVWCDKTDQVDDFLAPVGNPGNAWMIYLANKLIAEYAEPVICVPAARGGTTIAEWQKDATEMRGDTVPAGKNNLYMSSLRRSNLVGGATLNLLQLGENDALSSNSTTTTEYKDGVIRYAGFVKSDMGLDTIIVALHTLTGSNWSGNGTTTGQAGIRAGQIEAANEDDNIFITEPTTVLGATGGDGVHLSNPVQMDGLADIALASLIQYIEGEEPVNQPPVANAGPDQSVAAATQFTLDGTGSQDTDGTIVEWRWTQTAGDTVTLNLDDPARPTATSPSKTTSQRLTFQLVTVDDEGAESSPGTVNIDVAAFAVSEMLKLLDTRQWTVVNDGSVQAFEGRSNREAFRFLVTPSDGIQTSAEGYFLFDQPGVHAVEVISTPTSKISSVDDPHMIRGDVIAARIGDLQTDENGNLTLTFVLYVTDDKDGLVMTAKVIEPYQKASYFRKQG